MISLLIRTSLALLVFNMLLSPAAAYRSRDSYEKIYSDISQVKPVPGTNSGVPAQPPARRGLGISAWGIVILVVALILVGMGVYYISICYEICRPSKNNYNKMGMPTMA